MTTLNWQNHVWKGFKRNQDGAVSIEFALSIILVLTIIFMTFELVSAVYTYTVLADAANEGVRYAIVHSGDTAGAKAKVNTYAALSLHDGSAMNVLVTCTGDCTPPNIVTISITYQYIPYLNFMKNPPTMTAYAQSRIVN